MRRGRDVSSLNVEHVHVFDIDTSLLIVPGAIISELAKWQAAEHSGDRLVWSTQTGKAAIGPAWHMVGVPMTGQAMQVLAELR